MRNAVYELVETNDSLPFDVSLNSVNYVPSHWHNSVEIIFVLRGTVEVRLSHEKRTLSEGDVLLINQCHVHEVIGLDRNIIATFLIPFSYLKEKIARADEISFDCYSGDKERRHALDLVRRLLAEMVQLMYQKGDAYEIDMQIRMLEVLSILLKQFKVSASAGIMNEKYMERMLRIITYIEDHYKEPITLQAIAEREFLSIPYLSKFFSDNIGLNFQSYLTSIRLKYTVEELLHNGEIPIADIAFKHGFPNAKSFYTAFKARYNVTPSEYRKHFRPDLGKKKERESSNYLTFNQSSALGIISQYLQRSPSQQVEEIIGLETKAYQVSLSAHSSPIRHTWKNLIAIGKAKEGLHADVQWQLKRVQERCPFRYLRFHGIFDDSMMVYTEDETGKPVYNFRLVDELFDFLLSVRIKPFIELGFMPSALAADKEKSIFYVKSYISPLRSIDKWCELVDRFLRHCMNRYGKEEVESWKFEFWNEPELKAFWPRTMEEYMELYARTYETVKRISPRLQIGAPGRIITIDGRKFYDAFFAFCRERQCLPDFVPLHFYPHERLNNLEQCDVFNELESFRKLIEEFGGVSPNPDFLKERLAHEKRLLEKHEMPGADLYLTEWNSTSYHRELTNDTLYKAAYIVKNIIDNLDSIEGFGYWVLSDNIEETAASPDLFHGGLGLIAQHGIPKAGMIAYELLAKLGDHLIERGDRYIVTSGRGGYQVLTFNYCHFDDLYALGDISFIDAVNRYNGFKDVKTVKLELELTGLPSGKYRIVTRTLGRKYGSSYDRWVEMGAPQSLCLEDVEYLKAGAQPRMTSRYVEVENSHTCISILEPHGVELIEFIPAW
ncbi:helix-turn-helix domain-containing protein [Bacillus cereus group sp. N21]|uniref:GH39 family glycosyl hydrolase n=1 Tax=Bacillus cereus group sp. N21 TaxID=2794591 RepID=UPI0018F31637|nr:helix-turn-helix domain-containing protein [Bacillus cereus group sp. N21]MBJ8030177.1 helix-turn-helix domain-containing protein [Bacillus cereus group sp. N21]